MKLKLPEIKLNDQERIWINSLWEKIKKNEKISYKIIRAELYEKLPSEFNPRKIDNRVVQYGTEITLLGVHLIDPDYKIIGKTNSVIECIKQLLLKKPEIEQIEAKEIADFTNVSVSDVGMILKLISSYGHFWSSASGNQDYYGYKSISGPNDNETFDKYLTFNSIEELINDYFKTKEKGSEDQYYQKEFFDEQNKKKKENIFGSKIEQVDIGLCFVLMPFTEEWSDRVYKRYIRENIESMGLQCLRADNLSGQIIIEDIWVKINQAALIIADVTGRNPNVMYELGIAHTIGKPVILITQEIDKIPFDFTHLRHYEYEDNVTGQESFSNHLKSVIPKMYKNYYPNARISF
ncbi:MAG: hypothetical protein JXJ22_03200 [Bacteroidales bacterium]|nr:hypothetical protein [Bacteroidales bacterium]